MSAVTQFPAMMKRYVIAVGGGKGGTGKSLLTANLGIALAELKQSVILIDLDLGGANLHTCLGIRSARPTLGDFVQRKVELLGEAVVPTRMERLRLIHGANDPLEIANLRYTQKTRLIKHFKKLDADFILLDLGGGTSMNVLDFFLGADYGIVTATPEPTSLENASLFIKCVMMRHLKVLLKQFPIRDLKNRIKDPRNRETVRTFWDLMRLIRAFDQGAARKIETELQEFKFGLVLNQLREPGETRMGAAYQSMIRRCLGIRMDHLGQIYYDEKVPLSVKRIEPVLVGHPRAKAAHSIRMIAKRILGMDHLSPSERRWAPLFQMRDERSDASPAPENQGVNTPKERGPLGLRFYM